MRRDRKLGQGKLGQNKIVDDHTGFYIYSGEAVVTWEGYVTTRKNWDPKQYPDLPIPPIKEDVPPAIVRTEEIEYLPTGYTVATNWPATITVTFGDDITFEQGGGGTSRINGSDDDPTTAWINR